MLRRTYEIYTSLTLHLYNYQWSIFGECSYKLQTAVNF